MKCRMCGENEVPASRPDKKEPEMCHSCVMFIKAITAEVIYFPEEIQYFLATDAFHVTGFIGNNELDLCYIVAETKNYYIGGWAWAVGFGLIGVLFPKKTTRKAESREEAEKFVGTFRCGACEKVITVEDLFPSLEDRKKETIVQIIQFLNSMASFAIDFDVNHEFSVASDVFRAIENGQDIFQYAVFVMNKLAEALQGKELAKKVREQVESL